jgi:TusA-related sulfurtransferase
MEKIIHARRFACPDPVNRAKKALEQKREIVVIVDNDIAAAMAGAGRLVVP